MSCDKMFYQTVSSETYIIITHIKHAIELNKMLPINCNRYCLNINEGLQNKQLAIKLSG